MLINKTVGTLRTELFECIDLALMFHCRHMSNMRIAPDSQPGHVAENMNKIEGEVLNQDHRVGAAIAKAWPVAAAPYDVGQSIPVFSTMHLKRVHCLRP